MKSTDVKEIYNSDYFLKAVDGFREFTEFDGSFGSLFPRYQRNIRLLGLGSTHALLEVGCGRGEICIFHALRGGRAIGVDFSGDAINLAREKASHLNAPAEFVEATFDEVNFPVASFDRILASEFIEHISAEEGQDFILKAYSMLKPGGKLLIFTHPNTLYRKYGYPLYRLLAATRGIQLPRQQEDTTSEHYRLYHLNEQNFSSLRELAQRAGFSKVVVGYDNENMHQGRWITRILKKVISITPLRHIFLNNLFMLAEK